MLAILFAKIGFFRRDTPINSKAFIKYTYAAISLRMIKLVTLVLEDGGLGEYGKTMGEATRDEEL